MLECLDVTLGSALSRFDFSTSFDIAPFDFELPPIHSDSLLAPFLVSHIPAASAAATAAAATAAAYQPQPARQWFSGNQGGNRKPGLPFNKKAGTKLPPKPQQLYYCEVCKISCAGPQTYKVRTLRGRAISAKALCGRQLCRTRLIFITSWEGSSFKITFKT